MECESWIEIEKRIRQRDVICRRLRKAGLV
jgi:hypothetical protein